jgi:hypothetical protein
MTDIEPDPETVQLLIVADERAFSCPPTKVPCRECPLAKVAEPGALGGWTPEMYLNALHGPAAIACHMGKGFGRDGEPPDHTKQRVCTGVAMYRANNGIIAAGNAHAATVAIGNLHADTGKCEELAFNSPEDFFFHHEGKGEQLTGNPEWAHGPARQRARNRAIAEGRDPDAD